jgi:hypothetical protein
MKAKLLFLAPLALAVAACDPTGASLSGSGIDPLRPPARTVDEMSYGTELRPGEFVSAAVNNTAFYKAKPAENQEADKLLTQGTPMKLIDLSGSFAKVELDSGEVGFVPTVMLTAGDASIPQLDGAVDVAPPTLPVDGEVPLPVDPGTPPVTPEPVVPLPPQ